MQNATNQLRIFIYCYKLQTQLRLVLVMFKPTLKRSKLDECLQSVKPIHFDNYKPAHPRKPLQSRDKPVEVNYKRTIQEIAQPKNSVPLSILPKKMLQENPFGFYSPKQRLIAPLSSNFYDYPQCIKDQLNSNVPNLQQRGIGHFQGIFWFYRNQKLFLWHYLGNEQAQKTSFQHENICPPSSYKKISKLKVVDFDFTVFKIAIGRLNNVGNLFQKEQILLLAVAFSSSIHLFAIQDLAQLNLKTLNISIKTDATLTSQKLIITKNNELFFGGSSRNLSMYSFKSEKPVKISSLGFIQKFTRLVTFKTNTTIQNIQQIVTTHNRVYCLILKNKHRSKLCSQWINYTKEKITGRKIIPQSIRCIDVYEIGENNAFRFLHSVMENQVDVKIRNNFSQFANKSFQQNRSNYTNIEKQAFQFKSIFIDSKTGFLGISTKCGFFLILKDTSSIAFWNEPLQIPSIPQRIGLEIPYVAIKKDQNEMFGHSHKHEVLASKGFNNLSLLKNLIVYIDQNRFYILKCRLKEGQIFEINEAVYDSNRFPLLQNNRKWIIFQFNGFEIITKPEPRDFILAYLSSKQIEDEQLKRQTRSYKKQPFLINTKMQQLAHYYGYSEFCSHLFQLLIINQYSIRLNREFQQFIKIDILQSGARIKFQEWYTLQAYTQGNQDKIYSMNDQIRQKVWRYLIQYQSYPIRLSKEVLEKRNQSPKENPNALWFAIRFFLYKIMENILKWTPVKFVMNPKTIKLTVSRLRKFKEILIQRDKKIISLSEQFKIGDPYNRKIGQDFLDYLGPNSKSLFESVNKKYSKQNSMLQDTMQTVNQINQQSQYLTTNSTMKICQIVIEAIPKLLQIINIYQLLGDTQKLKRSQFSNNPSSVVERSMNTAYEDYNFESRNALPIFKQIIFSNRMRRVLKQTVIKYLRGPILENIEQILPQLQLGLDLKYINWKQKNMKMMMPEDVDISKLSIYVNSQKYLQQLKIYFKDFPDRYLALLIQKIKQLYRKDHQLSLRFDIYSQQNYFQKEQKKLLGQNKYAIDLQIGNYQHLIKSFLKQYIISSSLSVEPYQKTSTRLYSSASDMHGYQKQKRKNTMQKILKLVSQYCTQQIKDECQRMLRDKNLFDYVVFFRQSEPSQEFMDYEPHLPIQMKFFQKNYSSQGDKKIRFYDGRQELRKNNRQKRLEQMTTSEAAQFIKRKKKQQEMGKSLFLDLLDLDLKNDKIENTVPKSKKIDSSTMQIQADTIHKRKTQINLAKNGVQSDNKLSDRTTKGSEFTLRRF